MIHKTEFTDSITVVRPGAERLTASNAKVFIDEVTDMINDGATQIIIDFKDVSFLDSSTYSIHVSATSHATISTTCRTDEPCVVQLCHVSPL